MAAALAASSSSCEVESFAELMDKLSSKHPSPLITIIDQSIFDRPLTEEEHQMFCDALLISPAASSRLKELCVGHFDAPHCDHDIYVPLEGKLVRCYARLLGATPSLEKLTFFGTRIAGGAGEGLHLLLRSLHSSSLNITHLSFEWDKTIGEEDSLRHLAPILCTPLLNLQSLTLSKVGMGAEGVAHLAKSLQSNTSLLALDISGNKSVGEEGVEHIARMLLSNTSLIILNISSNDIGDVGMEHIARMLLLNTSLKRLVLCDNGLSQPSAKCLGIALAQNKTLVTLDISDNPKIAEKEVELMIPYTTNLKHLKFHRAPRIFKAFFNILRHNTTLTTLDLSFNGETEPVRVEELFKAIADNSCLQSLDLPKCEAVRGAKVVLCILDALQLNSWLVDLDISETPLEKEGQTNVIEAQLKQIKEENVMKFPQMQKAKPNRVRVFLCGLPYAGKTTLKGSMIRASKGKLHSAWHALSRDRLHSANERTRGIDIGHIVYSGISISLWDLAGQEDYYSFHDFMFPDISHVGSPSLFFILCKPMDKYGSPKEIECMGMEIKYWLRFISSKARPSELFKPTVAIVVTHKDKQPIGSNTLLIKLVDAIRVDFQPRLNLSDHVFHVNAQSSRSSDKILQYVHRTASNMLSKWPGTYSSCNQVSCLLNEWKLNHPFIDVLEFIRLCNKIKELKVTNAPSSSATSSLTPSSIAASTLSDKHKLVAHTLNNAGDILYFPDLQYIIVDLAWFCESLIGQMIKPEGMANQPILNQQEELIEWDDFVEIVSNSLSKCKKGYKGDPKIEAKLILQIMQKLNLCYARNTTTEESKPDIFIPANLIPTIQSQSWELDIHSPNFSVLGLRLQCLDQKHTILTPNFFPQIQIALYNSFAKDNNIECKLRKDFIKIIDQEHHGMEIHLEFHGYGVDDVLNSSSQHNTEYEYPAFYIDLLSKSAQNSDRALERLHTLVIKEIRDFCAKWRGCQGVTLIEGILRPDCVEQPEKYTTKQCALRSTLQDKLMKIPASEMDLDTYTWKEFQSLTKRVDNTKELLGKEAFMNVMNKRFKILQAVATDQETQEHCKNQSLSSAGTLKGMLHRGLATNESKLLLNAVPDEETLQEARGKQLSIQDSGIRFDQLQEFMSAKVDRLEEKVDAKLVRIEEKVDRVGGDVGKVLQTMEELTKSMIRMEEKVVRDLRTEIHAILDIVNGEGPPLQKNTPHLFYFTQRSDGMRERVAKLVASVDCYQLHFYCEGLPLSTESRHECDHEGLCLYFAKSERLRKAMPYLNSVLKVVTMVAKVGAHVVAGAGELVPDLAKLPALVFDSNVIDLASMKLAALMDPEVVEADHPPIEQKQSAEQWLVDLLIENNCCSGKSIAETFGLYRVRHKQSSKVAWVCDKHSKHPEFVPFAICP